MCALHHQALFHQAFQVVLVVKNLLANVEEIRDTGSIPVSGRFPRERHCNPLQYSCLKNPMDRGAWQAIVHRVTKIQTQLQQLSMHAHTIRHCIIKCFILTKIVSSAISHILPNINLKTISFNRRYIGPEGQNVTLLENFNIALL